MARLPWGGASTGWSAEFVGGSFIESDRGPWARRFQGAAFPEGRCFRASGSGKGVLGGTYMVSSLIARHSTVSDKSRLSVVYPASMCSTELRALMSSRCVSSLSSTRPGRPCPSSGFRYTGLTWIVITLLIAFATWGSSVFNLVCYQPALRRYGCICLFLRHNCPTDARKLVGQCYHCLVVASSLNQVTHPPTQSVVMPLSITGNDSGTVYQQCAQLLVSALADATRNCSTACAVLLGHEPQRSSNIAGRAELLTGTHPPVESTADDRPVAWNAHESLTGFVLGRLLLDCPLMPGQLVFQTKEQLVLASQQLTQTPR